MEEMKFIKIKDILEALREKAKIMFEKDTARGVRCVTLSDLEQAFSDAEKNGMDAEDAYLHGYEDGIDEERFNRGEDDDFGL